MSASGMAARTQKGISLIEVLVAVLILGVGLLGLAGLQANALRNTQSAYLSTEASILAYDFLDQARALGTIPSGNMIDEWRSRVTELFPEGDLDVEMGDELDPITITISWLDEHWRDVDDPDSEDDSDDEPDSDDDDARIRVYRMTSTL